MFPKFLSKLFRSLVATESLNQVRSSAWTWSERRGQYYYHQYQVSKTLKTQLYSLYPLVMFLLQAAQPDLNYRNPAVVEEMKLVLDFWLEKGIDGVSQFSMMAYNLVDG